MGLTKSLALGWIRILWKDAAALILTNGLGSEDKQQYILSAAIFIIYKSYFSLPY